MLPTAAALCGEGSAACICLLAVVAGQYNTATKPACSNVNPPSLEYWMHVHTCQYAPPTRTTKNSTINDHPRRSDHSTAVRLVCCSILDPW